MVMIKRDVEMTLPELIQWGWDNDVKEKAFYSNVDGGSVYFDIANAVSIEHEIDIDETFTVEVEEKITEDTKIENLVEVTLEENSHFYSIIWIKNTINSAKDEFSKAFYILNDDMTMTLIWKDGALV